MPLEFGDCHAPGVGRLSCPWSWEIFMPLELGEFYAIGVERILHVCPWCWESFMQMELREFYMYAPGVGRVLCKWS